MLSLDHPRDLVMIGAVFGVAAFAWAGWAQEQPPHQVLWRILLGVLSAAGLVLVALSVPAAIAHWDAATAIDPRTTGFTVYTIVFWAEVAVAVVLSIVAVKVGRADLIAPLILGVVGIHFFALAAVFHQPLLHLVAAVLTVIAGVAALIPGGAALPSFWCGVLATPVFLAAGAWCCFVGRDVLSTA